MPGIARAGVDTAGGTIAGVLVAGVRANGSPIAVQGATVASHGRGGHGSAAMSGASGTVRAGGHFVCRAGDLATCGHVATGSGTVSAG